jgi:hypothetical protein
LREIALAADEIKMTVKGKLSQLLQSGGYYLEALRVIECKTETNSLGVCIGIESTFIVWFKISLSTTISASIQIPKLHFHMPSMNKVFLGSDTNSHN